MFFIFAHGNFYLAESTLTCEPGLDIARAALNLFSGTAFQRIASCSLLRRGAEVLLRDLGRRHLAVYNRDSAERCQLRTLLGLLHTARKTTFGRAHDFRRIRTVADFRRLVPVRTWADLWREYWQPRFPRLDGVTWPGASGYFLHTSSEPYRPVALSPRFWQRGGPHTIPHLLLLRQTSRRPAFWLVRFLSWKTMAFWFTPRARGRQRIFRHCFGRNCHSSCNPIAQLRSQRTGCLSPA